MGQLLDHGLLEAGDQDDERDEEFTGSHTARAGVDPGVLSLGKVSESGNAPGPSGGSSGEVRIVWRSHVPIIPAAE